jgi:hypothetical protein
MPERHTQNKTVNDLTNTMEAQNPNNCKTENTCKKMMKVLRDRIPEKFNLVNETSHGDNLDHTPRRKRVNESRNIQEMELTFNPDVTEKETH